MNTDWNDFIQRHIAGLTSDDEAQRLETALKTDDALADLYIRHVELDVALEAKAASAEGTRELLTAPVAHRTFAWLSWRPLAAAAAGLVFGMFCTSMVFGYVMPRAMATASRLFALVDGSFEKQTGRLPSGFPTEFGVWSGDESEVVENSAANSKDGKRMLRFVRAEREPALPNYGAASCDVYQLVDLRSLKAQANPGETTLELSVQFLDARETAGEPIKFISRLSVFTGSPDALPAEWPLTQKEALAAASASFDSSGGAPRSWHNVTTKVLLPPQADFAVVHLVAHKPKNSGNTTATFGSQFADDVRLTLKTQPTLPVRTGRR